MEIKYNIKFDRSLIRSMWTKYFVNHFSKVFIIWPLMMAFIVYSLMTTDERFWWSLFGAFIVLAVIMIGIYFMRLQRSYSNLLKDEDGIYEYILSDDGIKFSSKLANGNLNWNLITGKLVMEAYILLTSQSVGYIPVSKAALTVEKQTWLDDKIKSLNNKR